MMMIGNRVLLHRDEGIASFLSRLAASNFCPSVREFCSLIGIDLNRVVGGDHDVIELLLAMAGVDPAVAEDRIVKADKLYNEVNGETLTRATFVRSRVRYCPCCIEEDIERGQERRPARPYIRMHWQVSFVRSCPRHQVMLCEGTNADGHHHDYARLLEAERQQPDYGHIVALKHTEFEGYVTERLWGSNRQAEWLDALPLYVAGRLCEWVGASLLFGKHFVVKDQDAAQWSDAAQAGFAILREGREGFVDFLKSLHDTFWEKKSHVGGRVLYGRLYERLAHETSDDAYDEIRQIMTDTAVAHLPMGPGDEMFGPVVTRKLHSIQSVSKALSFHPKTLRKLLEGAGWIKEDASNFTAERILFPAPDLEAFVEKMRDAINWTDARVYLNATRSAWNILSHDGFVPPAVASVEGSTGISPLYHKADLDHFLERLRSGARSEYPPDAGMLPILEAVKKANCKYAEVVQLLLDGKLEKASVDPDGNGLAAIVVDVEEIRQLTALEDHGGLSLTQAFARLAVRDVVLFALIDQGLIESEVAINPINRCPQRIVRPQEIERFESEYVSLFNYAKRVGLHARTAKAELDEVGITPALTKDLVRATFYRWSDIRAAAPPSLGQVE